MDSKPPWAMPECVPEGRQTVKAISKNCFACNLVEEKWVAPPKTPNLPNSTVNCSYAFEPVGIDSAGLLYVKDIYRRNENFNKCCLFLFIYATISALYLEIIQDALADALSEIRDSSLDSQFLH